MNRRPVETPRVDHGFLELLRVSLDEELTSAGIVTATITEPTNPADPETADQEDFWRLTERKIHGVRNGLPMVATIPQGAICWVVNYSGRWCVLIPECDG